MKELFTELKDIVVALVLAPIYWGICAGTGAALRANGGEYTDEINKKLFRKVYTGLMSSKNLEQTLA